MSTQIVISHATVETRIAQSLKDLFCDVIPELSRSDVWFSSDRSGSFDPRHTWFGQIIEYFRQCTVVVAIQSPVSKNRPWPLWESGFAFGLSKGPIVFTFAASGTISGHLGSPLDAQQHYDGTDAQRVTVALSELSKVLQLSLDPVIVPQKVREFIDDTHGDVQRCINASTTFDRRLILALSEGEFKHIEQNETVPATVEVIGDALTLNIFGLTTRPDAKLSWGEFTAHLESIETPWPSSSVRWAKNLGCILKEARGDRLISESEALPLYFSKTLAKSLRPALAKRTDKGEIIEFEIAFIDIPKELTVRPTGDLGILFHYLDFCRMMRWGVLESTEIFDLRTRHNLSSDAIKAQIQSLLTKIANIRTEFWNRGLQKDALLQAVEPGNSARIVEMMRNYYAIIEPLDPSERGDGPLTIPSREEFLARIDELTKSNKDFFVLVAGALNDSIAKL